VSFTDDEARRIERTVRVRDTDPIPKVDGAGEVHEQDGRRVQVMHDGVLVEADGYAGPWMTEVIRRLRGHHEPQEEPVFHAMVERLVAAGRPATMIELGAYWAYYSLWIHAAIGGARTILVEPDPANRAQGERNFALNGRAGEFVAAAVGRHRGRVRMTTEQADRPRWIPTVTVDGLMRDRGVDRLDLLLVDVQGAELTALQGARATIARGGLRFALVSTHHQHISGDPLLHQRCLAFLRDAGAHVITEHDIYESCSGDGLIAVSFDPADRDLRVAVSTVRARDSVAGDPALELADAHDRLRRYRRATGVAAVSAARRWAGEAANAARRLRG
jgi:FkbM family methyltransferase